MSGTANTSISFSGAPAWKDALEELLPQQGAWSEEQYLVLTDGSCRPVEYTDGVLEFLPLPTDQHQLILKFLLFAFDRFVAPRRGMVLFAPLRLRIRPGKYREPDLLLVLSADDPRRQNRYWTGADLVVEIISSDNPARDLVHKRVDYAEASVAEYWMVDPENKTIAILRLENGQYVDAGIFARGGAASSARLAGFAVDVSSTFDV
jgi:Uma2 family endonuclease